MAKAKGTGFSFLRLEISGQGDTFEKGFLAKLTEEEIRIYRTTLPITWLEIEVVEKIFKTAADMLYPDHPSPIREFGRQEARHALSGIYKLLLRFFSVASYIDKTAKLWQTYYDRGRARLEASGENAREASLIIEDFPDLSLVHRELILGYTLGGLELTGGKNIRGELINSDPNRWVLKFKWE